MDFFIAGYPKSGTTSLYAYLKSHQGVFLPEIKEPHFFTADFPGAREVETFSDYRNLFIEAREGEVLGDASASVIHSDVALESILSRFPNAKFILLVREPVSAVRSFHAELLHNLNENERDFEKAWRLQSVRSQGLEIPDTCKESNFLQYKEIFDYRNQLPHFVQQVPETQRLILVFEEFFSDPRSGYLKILSFLGLEDDGRTEFGVANAAKTHRFRWLAEAHRKVIKENGPFYRFVKSVLTKMGFHPSHLLGRFNQKKGGKVGISVEFERELNEYYQDDIATVERLLGRPMESWRS